MPDGVGVSELGLAAVVTVMLINAMKQAKPNIESWMLFVYAALVGVVASVLGGYAEGATFDGPSSVALAMQGLVAGLTAAGIDRQAVHAESRRVRPQSIDVETMQD